MWCHLSPALFTRYQMEVYEYDPKDIFSLIDSVLLVCDKTQNLQESKKKYARLRQNSDWSHNLLLTLWEWPFVQSLLMGGCDMDGLQLRVS